MGSKFTLCEIVVPEKILPSEDDNRNCGTCQRIILELAPEISSMLDMLEKE
jgi:hypothetical protein